MVEKKGVSLIKSISILNSYGLERFLIRAKKASHRKVSEIEKRLYTVNAGIAGEKKVLEYIQKLQYPFPFRVLWDVRLQVSPGQFVQIDLLVLTPTRIIIYEVKNISGRLRFEEGPARLDKVDPDGYAIDSYECPALQLEEEMADLRYWLSCRDIPYFVDGAVVMTANSVIEKATKGRSKVMRLREIRRHLEEERVGPVGRDEADLDNLVQYILDSQEPYFQFPLREQFNIQEDEIYWGPICDECGGTVFKKTQRIWTCESCKKQCEDVEAKTLLDWFLLRSRLITSEEVRKLFRLLTRQAAGRILRKFQLDRIMEARTIYYSWDYKGLRLPLRLSPGQQEADWNRETAMLR